MLKGFFRRSGKKGEDREDRERIQRREKGRKRRDDEDGKTSGWLSGWGWEGLGGEVLGGGREMA